MLAASISFPHYGRNRNCWLQQLDRAVEVLRKDFVVSVRWKPFELNPDMPKEGRNRRLFSRPPLAHINWVYCTISARRGSADAEQCCLLKALAAAVNKE